MCRNFQAFELCQKSISNFRETIPLNGFFNYTEKRKLYLRFETEIVPQLKKIDSVRNTEFWHIRIDTGTSSVFVYSTGIGIKSSLVSVVNGKQYRVYTSIGIRQPVLRILDDFIPDLTIKEWVCKF
jgi:hypothetical protein